MLDRPLISPRDLHAYREYVKKRDQWAQDYGDAEFLQRWTDYLSAKDLYLREFQICWNLVMKEDLSGPRRKPDFRKLFDMRRVLEHAAWRYFNYRSSGLSPLGTWKHEQQGITKDASVAQYMGRDDVANQRFQYLTDLLEARCKELWEDYQLTPSDVERPDLIEAMIEAWSLVQAATQETEYAERLGQVVQGLIESGRLKGAWQ